MVIAGFAACDMDIAAEIGNMAKLPAIKRVSTRRTVRITADVRARTHQRQITGPWEIVS